MTRKTRGPTNDWLWAYTYDIALPDLEGRLRNIQELVELKHSEALAGKRTWAAQVVVESPVTRILVVSDSPARDQAINRSIDAELTALGATFTVSLPMAVPNEQYPPRLVEG